MPASPEAESRTSETLEACLGLIRRHAVSRADKLALTPLERAKLFAEGVMTRPRVVRVYKKQKRYGRVMKTARRLVAAGWQGCVTQKARSLRMNPESLVKCMGLARREAGIHPKKYNPPPMLVAIAEVCSTPWRRTIVAAVARKHGVSRKTLWRRVQIIKSGSLKLAA